MMTKALTGIVLSVATAAAVGAGTYGVVAVNEWRISSNDLRYLAQTEYKRGEIRKLQYQVDELEFLKTQRQLTPKEQWQLQRLKSELRELKGG